MFELTYDDKNNKLIFHGHFLPCRHDDGFCKPTILTPFTIVWFPEDRSFIFSIHSFIGRMSKLNNRYWLETEHFFNNNKSHVSSKTPYHDSKSQTRLTRFEIFPEISPKNFPRYAINPHHYIIPKILTSLLHMIQQE